MALNFGDTIFPNSESQTNYNYNDIAAGAGMITYYLGKTGGIYTFSNVQFYSYPIYTNVSQDNDVYTKVMDIDFDVLLNRSITLRGNSIVNTPIRVGNSSSAVTDTYAVVRIRSWDGVNEVEIANGTSATATVSLTATVTYFNLSTLIIVPSTIIDAGKYLRVTVELWGRETVAGSHTANLYLGHDPMGMIDGIWTSTTVPTRLVIQIPMRIDI